MVGFVHGNIPKISLATWTEYKIIIFFWSELFLANFRFRRLNSYDNQGFQYAYQYTANWWDLGNSVSPGIFDSGSTSDTVTRPLHVGLSVAMKTLRGIGSISMLLPRDQNGGFRPPAG
jgi:hypothetical protein